MKRSRFIAKQSRHASGFLGRIIANIMAKETFFDNDRTIAALDLQEGSKVLDIGCGHGRGFELILDEIGGGKAVGIDPSATMIDIAKARNAKAVERGNAEFVVSNVEKLPFTDNEFDSALCVHVIYFWRDISTALNEISRVIKPNGKFALLFHSAANEKAKNSFPSDIYHFPPITQVFQLLEAAGFGEMYIAPAEGAKQDMPTLIIARKK